MKHISLENGEILVEGHSLGNAIGDGEEKIVYEMKNSKNNLISVLSNKLTEDVLKKESFRQESIDEPYETYKASFYFRKILQELFPGEIATEYLVTNVEAEDIIHRVRDIKREVLGVHHIQVEKWRDNPITVDADESIAYQEALAENSQLMNSLSMFGIKFDKSTHNLTDSGVYLDRIPAFIKDIKMNEWIKNYDEKILKNYIKKELSRTEKEKALKKLERIDALYQALFIK